MGKRNYNRLFNQVLERILGYEGHVYFVTLTMKNDEGVNRFTILNFIHRVKYRGVRIDGYIWVKELQKRGVVHFHMIVLVPERIRNFYSLVNESWGYGFVFVKGVEKRKVRHTLVYIMKYMRKELSEKFESEKMRRRIGRGGLLRFKVETFVGRVVNFSEFEYMGGGRCKGSRVKVYRVGKMVMVVLSSISGARFYIFELESENIVEQFKYRAKWNGLARILNDLRYLFLNRYEREEIIGYHKFDREINMVL